MHKSTQSMFTNREQAKESVYMLGLLFVSLVVACTIGHLAALVVLALEFFSRPGKRKPRTRKARAPRVPCYNYNVVENHTVVIVWDREDNRASDSSVIDV